MPREIKFRGWINENKEMIFFDLEGLATSRNDLWWKCVFDGMQVMQFTGLKDKNGKEIYEFDIIRYGSDAPSKIYFEDGSFKWSRNISLGESEQRKIEVIGNIYESEER